MNSPTRTRLKIKCLFFYLFRAIRRFLGAEKKVDSSAVTARYRRYWEDASQYLGAEFAPLTQDIWEVRLDGRHTRIKRNMTQLGDPVTNRIVADKPLCYRIAQEQGVPVPKHLVFHLGELDLAKQFIKVNPGVYVVKSLGETTGGVGVTTHICTPRELENAAVSASLFSQTMLLEQMIFGETCRLLWLGGEMIHATRQRGVRVTGDGQLTIAQLLLKQGSTQISTDLNVRWTLDGQNLTLETIPEAGREVLARSLTPEKSGSREPLTVPNEVITNDIGQPLLQEINRVLEVTESEIAGVDIITSDLSVSLKESGGILLEINPGPSIRKHYITAKDSGPDSVAVKILAYLLQPSRQKIFLHSSDRAEWTKISG